MTRIAKPGEVALSIQAGRDAERAAAVAWLRKAATEPVPVNSDEALLWVADMIERGGHLAAPTGDKA